MVILQANPSKNYGNGSSHHNLRRTQSPCCPIQQPGNRQMVVSILIPKSVMKKEVRKKNRSLLTAVLYCSAYTVTAASNKAPHCVSWVQSSDLQSKETQNEAFWKHWNENLCPSRQPEQKCHWCRMSSSGAVCVGAEHWAHALRDKVLRNWFSVRDQRVKQN